ncbi:MAG: WD40 repeat domain-containing serine/threonine-protein kinase [Pseudanabaenaceae cyanobacterium bins.39]|nr:WD40 repeat domain-containing serine/threonine-protein kinase [Pseudanabaenaceae cyanobacterium bins.39]
MATIPAIGNRFDNLLGGRFRVLQTLEQDTHGQTYLVEDTIAAEMPRWIAKSFCLINKTNLQMDWARSLFWREVPKLQQLSDRSEDFPKITTYFEEEEEFYIVEEAINGTRLSDDIARGKLYSEAETIRFLQQLLASLHTAHLDNMVHGDINPRNLIRRRSADHNSHHFVLTNFAVLKGVYATAAQNGVILGTPSYMPFEQALGTFNPSCDIYSLGLTAIQLLTGLHPSQLVRREDLNLLNWQIGSSINPDFAAILNRMVKHRPEERYQTAQEVLYDLDNLPRIESVEEFLLPQLTRDRQINPWMIAILGIVGIGWIGSQLLPSLTNRINLPVSPSVTQTATPANTQGETKGSTQLYKLRLTLTGHNGWVRSVAFFPNGFSFASGSYDRTIRLWNVQDNQSFGTLSNHLGSVSGINEIAVHPNGNTFATACIDKSIKLWNFRSGRPIRNIEGHDGQVYSTAYSPDGKTLISGSADKTVKLWDWNQGVMIRNFEGHQDKVVSVAFHPDGKRIASASFDKTIRIWDINTGAELVNISGHGAIVNAIAFSPDGKFLVSGSQDQSVKIWDVATGKLLRTMKGHTGNVLTIAINRDGTAIASGSSDTTIRIWDLKTGESRQVLSEHTAPILSLSFSSTDNTLVSGSADRTVKVWQLASPNSR